MRDARKEIVGALITAIGVKIPSRKVFTIPIKAVDNSNITPPNEYIIISDIYQEENGTKSAFMYTYDVLIEVVHNNINSKLLLWSDINSIETIVSSRRDLTLGNDFELLEISCESMPEEEILTETGRKTVGIIRFKIDIIDRG